MDMPAQRLLTEAPRSFLLGQWAQVACVLEQRYHGDWMTAAWVVSCSSSEKHSGAACWGSRLKGLVSWIGATAVTRAQQLRKGKS